MGVFESVEAMVKAMPRELRGAPEGPLALELARQLDADGPSAAMKSMCAKELRETLGVLRELQASARNSESDGIDDLQKQRELRRAKAAG